MDENARKKITQICIIYSKSIKILNKFTILRYNKSWEAQNIKHTFTVQLVKKFEL
jgi:hypothetical protein